MEYQTPQVAALASAIDAVQTPALKHGVMLSDGINYDEFAAYEDWE